MSASLFNRAMMSHQSGRIEEALGLYLSILSTQSSPDPHLLFMLGTAYFQLGQHQLGIETIQESLDMAPNPISYNNLGVMFSMVKRFASAVEAFEQAVRLEPNYAEAWSNLGAALRETGRLHDALESCDRAMKFVPGNVRGLMNRANVLFDLNRYQDASLVCEKLLRTNPGISEAHFLKGAIDQKMGRYDAAILSYDQAISIKPDYADAYFNRGKCFGKLKLTEESLRSYEAAIDLRPDFSQAWVNRGVALYNLMQYEESLASYDTAIGLDPKNAEAFSNRANVLQVLGNSEEVLKSHDAALAIEPEYAEACWNKALSLLLYGDYREGWRLYESRRSVSKYSIFFSRYHEKLWLGNEALNNKTILIFSEQGLGDVIQFCRYIPLLEAQGASVILQVPYVLAHLMQTLSNKVIVVSQDESVRSSRFDYQCPIMSLPLAFGTVVQTIPSSVPYLFADQSKTVSWKERLAQWMGFRVGLVWSGGSRENDLEMWGDRRDIPLHQLSELNDCNVHFFSLQKGEKAVGQLCELRRQQWEGPEIVDFTNEFSDFSDTAAFIENLDLVISVDTSTIHLAAALGKRAWLLNRFDTEWRWFNGRADSPWYPSLKIYRQTGPGDWQSVIKAVRAELLLLADS